MPADDITIQALDARFAVPSVFGKTLVSWDGELFAIGPDGTRRLPQGSAVFALAFPEKYVVTNAGAPANGPAPISPAPAAVEPKAPAAKPASPSPPPAQAEKPTDALPFQEQFDAAVAVVAANKQRAAMRMRTVADTLGIKGAGASFAELREAVRLVFQQADLAGQQRVIDAFKAEAAGGAP